MPRIIELPHLQPLPAQPDAYWIPVDTRDGTRRAPIERLASAITHRDLGDLNGDDHPHYLTIPRADDRYAPLWHSHPYDDIDGGPF